MHRDQERIYWFIRRMVIDHNDANDLVQDVFIKVWENLPQFREESRIIYWMYRIATNITLNFLDRKKRKGWFSIDDEDSDLKNKLQSGKFINADEVQLKLQNAILSLPAKQRIVFQLRYYDELPYEDMAGVLETSVGALKASFHHAVKKVEKFLLDEE
ncbi:MAG: sigma-70 family RNA polymerase sigma factor [Chitinophagales bacterium]|nr:sigma-70 family RNA polymerase sigma factor [Chitinophagales bacterium]